VGELTILSPQQKKFLNIALVLILVFAVISVSIMVYWETTNNPFIEYGEIKEYEGKDLSSINYFRENSIKGPQHVDIETYNLTVTGLVDHQKVYGYDDLIADHQSYKKVITLHCVEGWSVTILWEGIRLKDLFDEAQVKPEANTVIFYAYDGYSTALPLDYILDNNIMIAYKMNNITMPAERGFPFQLVAESKWGYKWIKWITSIELSDNADYLGFWESYGYPNNADYS
jgi:DMSO/TMAO reductase YedYZ molybdopterin-dependent catalytic subunit